MSMMEPDEPTEGMPEALRAQADLLLERWKECVDELRGIGLYVVGEPQLAPIPSPFGPSLALVCHYSIGRIAFSKRVQDPESEAFDDQFRVMEHEAADDAFLDARQEIAEAIKQGKNPYLDLDDEDDEPEGPT